MKLVQTRKVEESFYLDYAGQYVPLGISYWVELYPNSVSAYAGRSFMIITPTFLWPWIAVIRDFLAGERLGSFLDENPKAMAGRMTWKMEMGRILGPCLYRLQGWTSGQQGGLEYRNMVCFPFQLQNLY